MIRRMLLLALTLAAGTAVYGQCAVHTEAHTALKAVQQAKLLGTAAAVQNAIDEWMPTVIERVRAADRDRYWYKVAVLMATDLERQYARPEEARYLLELVAQTDQKVAGMWKRLARNAIERADRGADGSPARDR